MIGRFKGIEVLRDKLRVLKTTFTIAILTEREENVKADIFHAFIALLKQTKPSVGSIRDDTQSGFGANQEIYGLLLQQVPLIIKATSKQMKVRKIHLKMETTDL